MRTKRVLHPESYLLDRLDAFADKRAKEGAASVTSATRATKVASLTAGVVGSVITAPIGAVTGLVVNSIDSVNTKRHPIYADDGSFVLGGSRLERSLALIAGPAIIGGAAAVGYDLTFFTLLNGAYLSPTTAMLVAAGLGAAALGVSVALRGAWRGAVDAVKTTVGYACQGGGKVETLAAHLLNHTDAKDKASS